MWIRYPACYLIIRLWESSGNAGKLKMKSNMPNPICGVATICHRFAPCHALGASEFISCSQLSLIQNVLRVRFIIQNYLNKIYEHCFRCVCNLGHTGMFFEGLIIAVLTQNPTVLMFVDINEALKLWQKYVDPWVFVAVSGAWPHGEIIQVLSYSSATTWCHKLQVDGTCNEPGNKKSCKKKNTEKPRPIQKLSASCQRATLSCNHRVWQNL